MTADNFAVRSEDRGFEDYLPGAVFEYGNIRVTKAASLASPGLDELRWLKPVRPGDVLRIRVTVVEATPSRSRPDRGMVRSFVETLNQDGDVVMSMKPMNIIRRRGQP